MKIIGIEDIVNLWEDGWAVRENTKKYNWKNSYPIKGKIYPDIQRIILYKTQIENVDDYKETFMHELYHAFDEKLNETETEEIALHTIKYYPEVVAFAGEMFLELK